MKRTSSIDKLQKKRQQWIDRSSIILSRKPDAVQTLLSQPRQQSIRLNTLQSPYQDKSPEKNRTAGWPDWIGEQYPWMENGYALSVPVAEIRDDPRIADGAFFIQNAASWLPVIALSPMPDDKILDVCAAPGGKTSHIAALTHNQAVIWANDNSRTRLAKLQANMDRLKARIDRYTLFDATQLSRKLEGNTFDKILLDAPCSGEGLMNLTNDKDFTTWSVAHIKRLQQLQKRILVQAWHLLKPGGILVYSTCTMAPEENEAVVDYLLRTHTDAVVVPFVVEVPNRMPVLSAWNGKSYAPELQGALRLSPSSDIEAFFVCKLRKIATLE